MKADGAMKTILIVDDEPDIADVVTTTLEEQGYRVVVACNGVQGLERMKETPPDLLICDLMMPLMDGATMCQRLCSDPQHNDLLIIVASVMDEATIEEQFPRYDGFLRKPYRLGALLDLVDTLATR
jgi:CheY-like chemotaxis protein